MNKFTRTNYIPIGYGLFYIALSFLSLVMLRIQGMLIVGNPGRINQLDSFIYIYSSWSVYMPLLFMLGIMYALFGLVIKRNYTISMVVNSGLLLLSVLWFIFYNISLKEYAPVPSDKFASAPLMVYYFSVFVKIFGIFVMLVIICSPGFLIFYFLKKDRANSQL